MRCLRFKSTVAHAQPRKHLPEGTDVLRWQPGATLRGQPCAAVKATALLRCLWGHTAARILRRAGISMIKMSIGNFWVFVGYFEELFRANNFGKRARYPFVELVPCRGTTAGFRGDRQSPRAAGAAQSDFLRAAHREVATGLWKIGKTALFRRRASGVRDQQRPAGQPRGNDAASRGADAEPVRGGFVVSTDGATLWFCDCGDGRLWSGGD